MTANYWDDEKPVLPPDVAEVFERSDIVRAFDYLENVMHLSTLWRSDFERQYVRRVRRISKQEFFIRFTMYYLDPHLCVLTHRKESPTLAMLRFILKSKLEHAKIDKALGWKVWRGED